MFQNILPKTFHTCVVEVDRRVFYVTFGKEEGKLFIKLHVRRLKNRNSRMLWDKEKPSNNTLYSMNYILCILIDIELGDHMMGCVYYVYNLSLNILNNIMKIILYYWNIILLVVINEKII